MLVRAQCMMDDVLWWLCAIIKHNRKGTWTWARAIRKKDVPLKPRIILNAWFNPAEWLKFTQISLTLLLAVRFSVSFYWLDCHPSATTHWGMEDPHQYPWPSLYSLAAPPFGTCWPGSWLVGKPCRVQLCCATPLETEIKQFSSCLPGLGPQAILQNQLSNSSLFFHSLQFTWGPSEYNVFILESGGKN